MGKIKGFLEHARAEVTREPIAERVRHYREFEILPLEPAPREPGARCMSCGIPSCHNGCPLGNEIPDLEPGQSHLVQWQDRTWLARDCPRSALSGQLSARREEQMGIFRTLTVWTQAHQLARDVYPRTSHSPVQERYGLTEVEKILAALIGKLAADR